MKHLPINNKLFVENRKRFVKEMKADSIAIFNSDGDNCGAPFESTTLKKKQ